MTYIFLITKNNKRLTYKNIAKNNKAILADTKQQINEGKLFIQSW